MKLFLISLAIYYCLPCAYAVPTVTPSIQQFDGFPGDIVEFSKQNQDIDDFLNNLEIIDNLPKKIKILIDQLKTLNTKWRQLNKDLEALYKYFMDHITEYKTSQMGIYNFPSDKVYKLINDFTQLITIQKAFQNILTKLSGGGNSGLSGFSGLLGTSTNGEEGNEINEFTIAESGENSWIKLWQAGKTMGSKTAINVSDLVRFVAPMQAAKIPNFNTLVREIIQQVLSTQQSQ